MESSRTPRPTSTGVASGSAASSPHADPSALLPGALDRHRHKPQDRRVQGVDEPRNPGVAALRGEYVLREVVRAQGEEVDLAG